MSRVYFIRDARGERHVSEADLPLSVGGEPQADILLPGVEDSVRVAHIAIADGHAFIQPDDVSLPLYHNHERLLDSVWLKSGDQVQLDDAVLHWHVKGDQVFIRVAQVGEAPVLQAPKHPPPSVAAEAVAIPEARPPALPRRRRRLFPVFTGLFVLLVAIAAFVLLATPLVVNITPEPEAQSVSGFPPPVALGGRLLALPGAYTVHASLAGYRDLEQVLDISMGGFREYSFRMQELPGHVRLLVEPDVAFKLFVDNVPVTIDSAGVAEIPRGLHRLEIRSERYLPAQQQLDIAGLGKSQQARFVLQPAWAEVRVNSLPAGAEVRVDGESRGITPLETELLQGERRIELSLQGYKPMVLQQDITAGATLQLDAIELVPADGQLLLQSTPDGATINMDGHFLGVTPATLMLSSGQSHRLQLSKPGYRELVREMTVAPDGE